MRAAQHKKTLRTIAGTTLIEALIVMVILCISMITIAGMLNASIRSLADNLHHQRAVSLAADLAELLTGMSAQLPLAPVPPQDYGCADNTCDAQQFLAHSLQRWQQRIGRSLPAGTGSWNIVMHHGQPAAAIQINWLSRGTAASHTTRAPLAGPT